MAGGLTTMAARLGKLTRFPGFVACALLLASGSVRADTTPLPDPTRPPAGFVDESPKGGAAGGAAEAAVAARHAGEVIGERPAAGLQSVLIPRQGKPVAIIGGKYVPLGERWEGWELVAVRETEVVLARGKERKVLRLTPGAEKRTPAGDRRASGDATPGAVRTKQPLQARRDAGGASAPGKESETGR